jgi:hypothetical protein
MCRTQYPYDYHGIQPPYAPAYTYLEPVYTLQDPFSDARLNAVICVGGTCALCDNCICAASECSIFYSKRLCSRCVHQESEVKLPKELEAQVAAMVFPADQVLSGEATATQNHR